MKQSNSLLADSQIRAGVESLLFNCAMVQKSDRVLVVSNPSTQIMGELLVEAAAEKEIIITHRTIEEFTMHGQEPPEEIAKEMYDSTVIFGLTKMSMAHTKARFRANENGVKYFSLPDYSMDVLKSKALLADFKKIKEVSAKIADLFTKGSQVKITSANGTNLTLSIETRTGNPAPGFCYDNILLASPPDAETNIAPLETKSEGIAIIDGSIPCKEIGLLSSPVSLIIKNGSVTEIHGEKADILKTLFDKANNPKTRVIAEFGMGLNPLAKLCGAMLEDEGTLGTVHLGIGSNKTIGGLNEVPFHLDHIICNPTVKVDDFELMTEGKLNPELNNLLKL